MQHYRTRRHVAVRAPPRWPAPRPPCSWRASWLPPLPAVVCPKCCGPLLDTAIPEASLARCASCGLIEPAWGPVELTLVPQPRVDPDARLRAAVRAYLATGGAEAQEAMTLALFEAEAAARIKP